MSPPAAPDAAAAVHADAAIATATPPAAPPGPMPRPAPPQAAGPAGPCPPAPAADWRQRLAGLALGASVLLPVLGAPTTRPLPSLIQQAVAVAAWLLVLLLWPRAEAAPARRAVRQPGLIAAAVALGLLLLAALPAAAQGFLPELLVLLLGLLLMLAAARQGRPDALLAPLAWGLWIGGLASVAVLLHQHLLPCRGDGLLIALNRSGRAYGNLRQPNLMGSYLVLALAAGTWLAHTGRLAHAAGRAAPARRALAGLGAAGLVLGVALTASRTAALALLLLTAWGLLDRRLGTGTGTGTARRGLSRLRAGLLALPLVYLLAFGLASVLPRAPLPAACGAAPGAASDPAGGGAPAGLADLPARADRARGPEGGAGRSAVDATDATDPARPADVPDAADAAAEGRPGPSAIAGAEPPAEEAPGFSGSQRLAAGGDLSSGRGLIYRDTWTLIQRHPWTGVGWGQLPLAWMLSEGMVWRRGLLGHAHNLPLHLAVEIGLPATAAVLLLLGAAAWGARRAVRASPAAAAAAVMLLALGWHSLLEYPLWYAYFLLPACWLAGLLLGTVPPRGGAAGSVTHAGEPGADGGPEGGARLPSAGGPAARDAARDRSSAAHPEALARPDRSATAAAALGPAAPPGALAAVAPLSRPRLMLGSLGLLLLLAAMLEFHALRPLPRIPEPQARLAAIRTALGRPFYGHFAGYLLLVHRHARPEPRHFATALRQAYSVRLLWHYSQSLARAGRSEHAVYITQRLREFRNDSHPDIAPLFRACEDPQAAARLPCRTAPPPVRTWTEVLP